jgi:3-phosphoshikimate 1-carboxyvinyltransferase
LTAVLATLGGAYRLEGVARMHERPVRDLVDALRALGSDVRYLARDGYPPLAIGAAGGVAGATVNIRGDVSSQFLSALLLALPLARRSATSATTVKVLGPLISRPYVDITTNLMRRFGVTVAMPDNATFVVPAGARYATPGTLTVESDASSASYFQPRARMGGEAVRVSWCRSRLGQGDVASAPDVLAQRGCRRALRPRLDRSQYQRELSRWHHRLCRDSRRRLTLADDALFADAPTTLTNIGGWRVKETDRIVAMATELAKLGVGDQWRRLVAGGASHRGETAQVGGHRHLRRSPDGDVLFPGDAQGRAGDDQRSGLCPEDLSRLLRRVCPHRPMTADGSTVIAVDGPAASGKGTVAAGVARALGFHYLDSGSLYRLVALRALQTGTPLDDGASLARLAAGLDATFDDGTIVLAGQDATDAIRTEAVSAAASRVVVHPAVRAALFRRQRGFRRPPGLVADGRDMGNVVFPDALVKVFVTASAEERARRRYKQLIAKGISVTMESLLHDIRERDARDAGRAAAPLKPAPDAVILDTTELTIEAAIDRVLGLYRAAAER